MLLVGFFEFCLRQKLLLQDNLDQFSTTSASFRVHWMWLRANPHTMTLQSSSQGEWRKLGTSNLQGSPPPLHGCWQLVCVSMQYVWNITYFVYIQAMHVMLLSLFYIRCFSPILPLSHRRDLCSVTSDSTCYTYNNLLVSCSATHTHEPCTQHKHHARTHTCVTDTLLPQSTASAVLHPILLVVHCRLCSRGWNVWQGPLMWDCWALWTSECLHSRPWDRPQVTLCQDPPILSLLKYTASSCCSYHTRCVAVTSDIVTVTIPTFEHVEGHTCSDVL